MDEYLVKTLDDVVGTKLYKKTGLGARLFRGQADFDWAVVPGLYRSWNPTGPQRSASERKSLEQHRIKNFVARAEHYVKPWRGSFLRNLILAQHYGLPTRLLDWSTNPLIAVYFAVADYRNENDGALIFGNSNNAFNAFHVEEHDKELKNVDFLSIEPPTLDQRIIAQHSVFTLSEFERDEEYFQCLTEKKLPGQSFAVKLRIPAAHKPTLHGQLRQYGITPEVLFPGIGGLGAAHGLELQEQLG